MNKNELKIIQALLFQKHLPEIYKKISVDMFEDSNCAFIFNVGLNLYRENKPCDLTAIFEKISNEHPEFYKVIDFDTFITDDIKNVYLLVENFIEDYVKRNVQKKLSMLTFENKTIGQIHEELNDIRRFIDKYNSAKIPTIETFKNDLEVAFNGLEEKLIKTGYPQFDQLLNGGYRTGISFIGAFTKVGKSCFARNLAYNVSRNHKVAYFNFEMDKHEFLRKMVNVYKFHKVTDEKQAISELLDDYKNYKMLVLNQHSRKLTKVINTIEYLANECGIKFFVIDTFDKLLNEKDDSWYGFTKNILQLEEVALNNDIVILALKQLNVETFKWIKDQDSGKYYKKKTNPKCIRPSVQDSVGTKEPARTASSFITMFWDENDWSVVNFVEQCERYNTAGMMNFEFYKENEVYIEIENSLSFA